MTDSAYFSGAGSSSPVELRQLLPEGRERSSSIGNDRSGRTVVNATTLTKKEQEYLQARRSAVSADWAMWGAGIGTIVGSAVGGALGFVFGAGAGVFPGMLAGGVSLAAVFGAIGKCIGWVVGSARANREILAHRSGEVALPALSAVGQEEPSSQRLVNALATNRVLRMSLNVTRHMLGVEDRSSQFDSSPRSNDGDVGDDGDLSPVSAQGGSDGVYVSPREQAVSLLAPSSPGPAEHMPSVRSRRGAARLSDVDVFLRHVNREIEQLDAESSKRRSDDGSMPILVKQYTAGPSLDIAGVTGTSVSAGSTALRVNADGNSGF